MVEQQTPEVIEAEAPELYAKQYDAIFAPARYKIVEASTKAGKTTAALIWQLDQACQHIGEHWWVAPVYTQADIAYTRAKAMLPAAFVRKAVDSKRLIILTNGSRWWFKTGEKPDNLYGDDVLSAVLDEASRLREASWHAVRSTLTATRAPAVAIGNVRGRSNWFYKLARRAEAGAPNHAYARLTAYDAVEAGVLDAAEIEDARAALPPAVFAELYEAAASDDGSNPFGPEHIDAVTRPLAHGPVVAWGVDLAKSVDFTACFGVNALGQCCHYEAWQHLPWKETRARIIALDPAPMLLDSTGVGDPILEDVQEARPGVEGYHFNATSRQQLLEGLRAAIHERTITVPEEVAAQLHACEWAWTRTQGVRYQVFEGMHDDGMMSAGLARECFRRHGRKAPTMFDAARHAGDSARRAVRRAASGGGETTEAGARLRLRLSKRGER